MSSMHVEVLAGLRWNVQTGHVHRHGWRRLADLLVGWERFIHCLNVTTGGAANDGVAHAQRPLANHELGDHSSAFMHFRFQACADRVTNAIGS